MADPTGTPTAPQADQGALPGPLAEPDAQPLTERLKGWLDALLVADVFLVILRTGIVLAADGGALGKMLPIFRAG